MNGRTGSIAAFGVGLFAIVWLGAHNVLFNRFSRSGCPAATPQCTHPLNNHGYISYISNEQALLLQALWIAFLLFAICAAALAVFSRFGRHSH